MIFQAEKYIFPQIVLLLAEHLLHPLHIPYSGMDAAFRLPIIQNAIPERKHFFPERIFSRIQFDFPAFFRCMQQQGLAVKILVEFQGSPLEHGHEPRPERNRCGPQEAPLDLNRDPIREIPGGSKKGGVELLVHIHIQMDPLRIPQ